MILTGTPITRVMSIHPHWVREQKTAHTIASRKEEFDRLVISSHCQLIESMAMPLRKISSKTLLGSGQCQTIADGIERNEITVVFIDHQLTPVQQRNLEKALNAKVVDRTGLILEIFASRAKTREGVLQVELASLNYQISRLVRSWTHLERQRGGFGFMGGPGERQIELDRRMIRNRIQSLEQDLAHVQKMRATQRQGRQRKGVPTVALVGYTNAGKSTLFNRLTNAEVFAADQLFATLDPTLRELPLGKHCSIMLSDTVGFVQDLPHELVNAFRATLEEVTEADLILHVRDISDPETDLQKRVVDQMLIELGLIGDSTPMVIEILNKVDAMPEIHSRILPTISGSRIACSALHGQGIEQLFTTLRDWAEAEMEMKPYALRLPISDGKTLAFCYANGRILEQQHDDGILQLMAMLPIKYARQLQSNHPEFFIADLPLIDGNGAGKA
ncbi:MAG: GTPase HflX [Zetaproteobacteria bacterium]|nr:GTPase HflX [Zetaproteobacteria bacterium]